MGSNLRTPHSGTAQTHSRNQNNTLLIDVQPAYGQTETKQTI